jgi:hypothetical protein
MAAMTTALPNLQQIRLQCLGQGNKYNNGEDPDEEEDAETRNYITHDVGIISNFRKLRSLEIDAPLNGRYPVLFNFPLLQSLIIVSNNLKLDLEMLSGLPSLTEFYCDGNPHVTGKLNSLKVLKDTLETVDLYYCQRVEGDLMDLADFPHLKYLGLQKTNVGGDIRDIGENDFTALEELSLPAGVYGGMGYHFQSIAEASDFISRIYLLAKRKENIFQSACSWELSRESPDWYNWEPGYMFPPFEFELVIITGSRIGWRWKTTFCYSGEVKETTSACEIKWLEPEPDRESSGYEDYTCKLNALQEEIDCYKDYDQPPTHDEYQRLCYGDVED